ncbi:MAG: hypothetical protein Q8R06_17340 [Polaromonas sp.]|nr:hypothetical protein [Polaromonas sp.]MDP3798881.1 hypothetical protein [Polaromonas sp.]
MTTFLVTRATPFSTAEAAREAVEDHCSGCGVIYPVWIPDDAKEV